MKLQLFGLLHLKENQLSAVNIRTKNFADQVQIYIRNAINLSNTLESQGVSFKLLTNKKYILDDYLRFEKNSLQVEEIPFITEVPNGARFYSAHFKLDAFRYLSKQANEYVGLCDIDMVCANGYPACLDNIVKAKLPLYYDISDQVIPAYGHEVIIDDLKIIHGIESEGRWCGGEFISGTPAFFSMLVDEIESIYPNYIANISNLHHVGDEAFTTAALELLRRKGVCIGDAGTLGIVGRFWNTHTLHCQKPFESFKKCFLLHLPADKRFLAEVSLQEGVNSENVLKFYVAHMKKYYLINAAKKLFKFFINK